MYSFPNLEPVHCSVSGSNCCFLNCIQISQEAGKVVWYSHLFKNFPQFIVIHRVKGFSKVNEAEVDFFFFWNSLAISMIHWMLAIWSLISLPFLNPAWTSGSSQLMYHWSLTWRIFSITLLVCEMSAFVQQFALCLVLPFFGTGMKTDLFQKLTSHISGGWEVWDHDASHICDWWHLTCQLIDCVCKFCPYTVEVARHSCGISSIRPLIPFLKVPPLLT